MLTREQVLAADDLPLTEVQVPQWSGSVFVRSMNAEERADLEKRFADRDANMHLADFRATLVVLTTTNDKGELLFSLDDIAALRRKNAAAIERVFEVSAEKNGFTKKDVEKLEKNSESGPSAASPSA